MVCFLHHVALRRVVDRRVCAGAFWKHSRELFRPQFSRENINDLDATDCAARTLLEAVEIGFDKRTGWTSEVDMLPLFYNLTLDTSTGFLFGESVGAQKAGIHKATGQHSSDTAASSDVAQQASSIQFGEDFETLGTVLQRRILLQALYWLGDGRKFRRAIANSHAFIERIVQDAINGLDTEKKSKKAYLLPALVTQTQDRVELRNQALAMLFAGRDTTAALLAWCTVRLALHTEVFAELRRAILAHFGDTGDADITFSALKACRPLQHFINEVLRLNTIVPFNNRVAVRNTTLPVGGGADQKSPIAVRKGTNILYSVYVMHRRKDLWGEDALEFKPSRWEERRATTAWQFLPFNGGPRICLGQQYAIVETSYVLVRLLQRYQAVEAVNWEQMAKMKNGIGLAMNPADGARVRWRRSEV